MSKSEFAFATVKTVKPLTIQLDGDPTVIPAVTYGVTVKVKDRVEVRVRRPPLSPLITRVFNPAPPTGLVRVDTNQFVTISTTKDLSDSDKTISGWSIIGSSEGFTAGDAGIGVDGGLYPDGTAFSINGFITVSDVVLTVFATSIGIVVSGGIDGGLIQFSLPFFASGGIAPSAWASSCLAPVQGGGIDVGLIWYDVNNNIVSGSLEIEVTAHPLLTVGGTS